ncbi:MAG: hypothetical protein FRX49_07332 [Trebouxia sp. A1-2]|nr:MAG: hypothetical protein FRX49_07332 [Trebouxia sp. A1-2]
MVNAGRQPIKVYLLAKVPWQVLNPHPADEDGVGRLSVCQIDRTPEIAACQLDDPKQPVKLDLNECPVLTTSGCACRQQWADEKTMLRTSAPSLTLLPEICRSVLP